MKHFFILILAAFSLFSCAQDKNDEARNWIINKTDLIGIWQYDDDQIANEWRENYQFFSDGNFKFNFHPSDYANRIVSLEGKYRLKQDTLILTIEYTLEATGGYITKNDDHINSSLWSLEGTTLKKVKQEKVKEEKFLISTCEKTESAAKCIMLDRGKYYRMESDPTKY